MLAKATTEANANGIAFRLKQVTKTFARVLKQVLSLRSMEMFVIRQTPRDESASGPCGPALHDAVVSSRSYSSMVSTSSVDERVQKFLAAARPWLDAAQDEAQ